MFVMGQRDDKALGPRRFQMKTKRWNEKTRLLLTLELAVILPAAALVLLSAWHVQHIQRDRAVEAETFVTVDFKLP